MDKIKDLPNEEWKEIKGYGGKYLVSNCGRIKSLKHYDARLLTAFVNNKGYPRVALSQEGQSKHFLVSRLVAEAFCANPDPERARTVDHIDGDKENNRADNLRWLSFEDNMREYSNRKRKQDTKNHTQTGPYVESNSQVSRSSSCLAIQLNEDPTHFISRQKLPQVATMTANDHVESSQSEDTTSGRKVNPHPTESEELRMIEKLNRPIPEYNHRLYENGYEPWEILAAAHQKILAAAAQEQPEDYTVNVKSTVEVKK